MLAEFLLCILLVTGFGAGSLFMLHREQQSHTTLTLTTLRSDYQSAAADEHHLRAVRDLRIMLAATMLLSLALVALLFWRMDRLCAMFTRTQQTVHHDAHHDALTGLPNTRLLSDRLAMALAHARRVKQLVAVVAVDLEGFRQISEEHGPEVADEVLRQAATRLQRLSRDADTVARTRGDEFVMVLSDVKSGDHATRFAERLINSLSGTYTADARDVTVAAHAGVSLFSGQATSADDLVRAASAALWKSRNGVTPGREEAVDEARGGVAVRREA